MSRVLLIKEMPVRAMCTELPRTLIAVLLRARRPSAIPRLVIAVVLDSVDAVFRTGLLADIREEVDEAVLARPSLADADASTAVVWI